ncbi:hypothetical protein ABL78_0083 [Leptomonas seymouri]|uniref:Uncharacterized protein n=1 Tax=Leptomonas seymouri TaxID=5684 RepID=A0A0N1I9E0_LEPSE|nr:hypothetical protein ABL78_0083 [Leptomonas seymouri]|eukprot:KPI90850.1 hypothetical protein ABL78_0083 [Leptomonas seymouri]
MSNALHSLDLDKSLCSHYYHCVLSNIPFHTPLADIAPHVVPRLESDTVKKLTAIGCRVVPHQLHVYKEPLDTKFGYVSFFIHQVPNSTASAAETHLLILEWVDLDLTSQLQSVKCKVQLAQPPECHSSEPFLEVLRQECPLLDPGKNLDTKRLETFLLTHVRFGELRENAWINERGGAKRRSAASSSTMKDEEECLMQEEVEGEAEEVGCTMSSRHMTNERVWKPVARFSISSLSPKELVWLKRQLPSFPPLLITDNNIATAHCDAEKLKQFFAVNLAPLIELVDEE